MSRFPRLNPQTKKERDVHAGFMTKLMMVVVAFGVIYYAWFLVIPLAVVVGVVVLWKRRKVAARELASAGPATVPAPPVTPAAVKATPRPQPSGSLTCTCGYLLSGKRISDVSCPVHRTASVPAPPVTPAPPRVTKAQPRGPVTLSVTDYTERLKAPGGSGSVDWSREYPTSGCASAEHREMTPPSESPKPGPRPQDVADDKPERTVIDIAQYDGGFDDHPAPEPEGQLVLGKGTFTILFPGSAKSVTLHASSYIRDEQDVGDSDCLVSLREKKRFMEHATFRARSISASDFTEAWQTCVKRGREL